MSLSELRRQLARELVTFLDNTFTEKLGEPAEWWNTHVVQQLSYGQKGHLRAKGIDRLGQLDLHALLRIFDRNWAEISYWCSVSNEVRTLGKGIADQRHNNAHEAAELTEDDPSDLYRDIDTLVIYHVLTHQDATQGMCNKTNRLRFIISAPLQPFIYG